MTGTKELRHCRLGNAARLGFRLKLLRFRVCGWMTHCGCSGVVDTGTETRESRLMGSSIGGRIERSSLYDSGALTE